MVIRRWGGGWDWELGMGEVGNEGREGSCGLVGSGRGGLPN